MKKKLADSNLIAKKDPAAVALGRKGGLKGGIARAKAMTPEQRSESARKAVLIRWAKEKATGQDLLITEDYE